MYLIAFKSRSEHEKKVEKMRRLKELADDLYRCVKEDHEEGFEDDELDDEETLHSRHGRSRMESRGRERMALGSRYRY